MFELKIGTKPSRMEDSWDWNFCYCVNNKVAVYDRPDKINLSLKFVIDTK